MKIRFEESKRVVALSLAVGIAASGCGSSSASQPKSVGEALAAGDKSGSLPALNRDATVAGPDADGNGVRDDIDAYIEKLTDTAPQKSALRQVSAAITAAMTTDATNQPAVLAASKRLANASSCTYAKYDPATAKKKNLEMRKLTVNTKVRVLAYLQLNLALSGTTVVLPQGDGCAN